jgi:hypothetical protein
LQKPQGWATRPEPAASIGFQQQAMLAGLFGIAVLLGKQIHKAAGTFHPYVEQDFARGRENLPPSLILFILRG